jgi:hypothetical protein
VGCGRKWRKFNGTGDFSDLWTIDAGAPRTDGISCDEFAFANAKESAGNRTCKRGRIGLTGTVHPVRRMAAPALRRPPLRATKKRGHKT